MDMTMFRHTLVNHFLEQSAQRFSDKTALIYQGQRFTYAEIDSRADRLAHALAARGVERGDRVAVFMDNSVEAVIALFGILKANAAFMMINHTTKAGKLEFIMNNSRAKVLIAQASRADVISSMTTPHLQNILWSGSASSPLVFEEITQERVVKDPVKKMCIDLDLASIVYTSGSTGNPKGVMLSHLNMVSAAHSITTYLENTDQDIIINMLPLTFDYGLYQVLMGFRVGATVVLEKSFAYPAQILKIMVEEKVTGFPGVPTIFSLLLQMKDIQKYDFSSLRYITNTAAALPVSHIKRLRELFPQAKLYSMYGLTECKRVSYLPPEDIEKKPASVGKGMPNEEIFLVDGEGRRTSPGEVGELVVRGSNVMLGYWEMPEETAKCLRPGRYPGERFLYTGDLFKTDEDGYFYFVARKDDIIKCKGEKVSPKEVENVLYALNGIVEAAVVGIPDEIFGQAIKAYVALETGAPLKEKDILKYCAEHLENFMVPKYIEIRETLPKTATGKISKTLLTAVNG